MNPNYFQVRFSTADGYHEDLRADTKATATFVVTQLKRMKAIKNAYVVERKANGDWVRNW